MLGVTIDGVGHGIQQDHSNGLRSYAISCQWRYIIDEHAAIGVLPYAEPRDVRVGFWTRVLGALDPEVSQSVSQSVSR